MAPFKTQTLNVSSYAIIGNGLLVTGSISGNNQTTSFNSGSATGLLSFAEGTGRAFGPFSHAEGTSIAFSSFTHAEGSVTRSTGEASHSEGHNTFALGRWSHAEGNGTVSSGDASHSEGGTTQAIGGYSHAEGYLTQSIGVHSHAEGFSTQARGEAGHTEGTRTFAISSNSHAEGNQTTASGPNSHAEGSATNTGRRNPFIYTFATRTFTFSNSVSGNFNYVTPGTVIRGYLTTPYNSFFSFTVASRNTSTGAISALSDPIGTDQVSFQNYLIDASGVNAHAEGNETTASGQSSHAEGQLTTASGSFSHAEGNNTTASGQSSHAEGALTTASGNGSHAEGQSSTASGDGSHAEGLNTIALGSYSHAEGAFSRAIGGYSHAAGIKAVANTSNSWIWRGLSNPTFLTQDVLTTRAGQFMVSAEGGMFIPGNVGIGTDNKENALTIAGRTVVTDQLYYSTDSKISQLSALSGNYDEGQFLGKVKLSQNNTRLINVGENWLEKEDNRVWLSVAISSDGKYQTGVVLGGLIYTSSDYGNTWTSRSLINDWIGIAMSSDGKYQTATSYIFIYFSDDYGNTWTEASVSYNPSLTPSFNFLSMSSDGKYQSAGASNGIYISRDYGKTWIQKTTYYSIYDVAMSSDGRYQSATQYLGSLYISNDYGETWTAKLTDVQRAWQSIAISSDGRYQTAVDTDGKIHISSDYGNTWRPRQQNRAWFGVAMSSTGQYQVAAASSGNIYISSDYGYTWIAKAFFNNWTKPGISADGKYIVVGGDGSKIYISKADELIDGNLQVESLTASGTIYSTATANVLVSYTQTIGNGTSFFIPHNLNTNNIQVQVFKVSDGTLSYPTIEITNVNAVTVTFAQSIPSNSYRAVIYGSVPSNQINAYGEIYTFYTAATGLGDIPALSGNWNTAYTMVTTISTTYTPEDLAIAYAIVL